MTDTEMLRGWIETKGLKYKSIAAFMGITPYSLQKKIDNETEFKASEISVFTTEYGMSPETRDLIFFAGV